MKTLKYTHQTTKPPGPITNKVVQGCYASCFNDCGGSLSREHYYPKCALIELFEYDPINITGWIPGNSEKTVPITAEDAFARVLCERHNNALSGMDAMIKKWCQCVKIIHGEIDIPICEYSNISSKDMSLILLQISCGMMAHHKKDFPKKWIEILFSMCDNNIQLYQTAKVGDRIYNDKHTNHKVLEINNNPIGCQLETKGFTLATFIDYELPNDYFLAKKIRAQRSDGQIYEIKFK